MPLLSNVLYWDFQIVLEPDNSQTRLNQSVTPLLSQVSRNIASNLSEYYHGNYNILSISQADLESWVSSSDSGGWMSHISQECQRIICDLRASP